MFFFLIMAIQVTIIFRGQTVLQFLFPNLAVSDANTASFWNCPMAQCKKTCSVVRCCRHFYRKLVLKPLFGFIQCHGQLFTNISLAYLIPENISSVHPYTRFFQVIPFGCFRWPFSGESVTSTWVSKRCRWNQLHTPPFVAGETLSEHRSLVMVGCCSGCERAVRLRGSWWIDHQFIKLFDRN